MADNALLMVIVAFISRMEQAEWNLLIYCNCGHNRSDGRTASSPKKGSTSTVFPSYADKSNRSSTSIGKQAENVRSSESADDSQPTRSHTISSSRDLFPDMQHNHDHSHQSLNSRSEIFPASSSFREEEIRILQQKLLSLEAKLDTSVSSPAASAKVFNLSSVADFGSSSAVQSVAISGASANSSTVASDSVTALTSVTDFSSTNPPKALLSSLNAQFHNF